MSDNNTDGYLVVNSVASTWQCTGELRFVERQPLFEVHRVLQQQWVCLGTGVTEWRDVPCVREGE